MYCSYVGLISSFVVFCSCSFASGIDNPESKVTDIDCPRDTFVLPLCEYVCHCPEGDSCDPNNGLCNSGTCHPSWTGAGCQTRHPVMKNAPVVTGRLVDCAVIVCWTAWSSETDIGVGPIDKYILQVQCSNDSWVDVKTYPAYPAQNTYLAQYMVSEPSRDAPHSFRLLLYRLADGKPVPSIPGPESMATVLPCASSTILPPVSTMLPILPEISSTVKPTPLLQPDQDNNNSSYVLLPLPVTLVFTADNEAQLLLKPWAMKEISGPLWLLLTPVESYNKEDTLIHKGIEIQKESGVNLGHLPPGTRYKFEMTSTKLSDAMLPVQGYFWTPPFKPPTPPSPTILNVTNNSIAIIAHPLSMKEMMDSTSINSFQIIVEEINKRPAIDFDSVRKDLEFESQLNTDWLQLDDARIKRSLYNDANYYFNHTTNFYVTAELPGNFSLNETILIGDGNLYGGYWNTPLKENTEYRIWTALTSTLGGVTRRSFSDPIAVHTFSTVLWNVQSALTLVVVEQTISIAIIIILVMLILIIIGISITLYIVCRRRKQKRYFVYSNYPRRSSRFGTSGTNINNSAIPENMYHSCDVLEVLSDTSLQSSRKSQPEKDSSGFYVIKKSNPIPIKELPKYLDDQDGTDYTMVEEFRSLPNKFIDSVNAASMPCNSLLNRSTEVIPYDKNRVKLAKMTNEDTYVNASCVQSIDKMTYLVTQTPMTTTMTEFWRMVWEHEVGCIVMLMDLCESGKPQCEQYWPDKNCTRLYGNLSLYMINVEATAHYLIRDIKITHLDSRCEREVTHFQFVSWDHCGLPPHTIPYVDFVCRVHEERVRALTTLVHCHAGGGRSGVFIAVDSLLTHAKQVGKADILRCVTMLRLERPNLVKTFKQYKFVYKCLAELFDHPESKISGERFQFAFDNLLSVSTPNKMSFLANEYEKLRERRLQQQRKRLVLSTSDAADSTNLQSPKKRDTHTSPDLTLHLPMLVERDLESEEGTLPQSSLLGPVIVDSFRMKNGLVVSEYPSDDYFDEFWKLIVTKDVSCIVDLNSDFVSSPLPKYFPAEDTPFLGGSFVLKLTSQSANPFESSSMIEVTITCLDGRFKIGHRSWAIRLFRWHGWPSDKVVPSVTGMLNLLKAVRAWGEKTHKAGVTMTIGCQIGRAALFCLAWLMSERLEDEWLVDIYMSTKYLQHTVPRAISNFEQYKFLYQVMKECVCRIHKHGSVTPSSKRSRSLRLNASVASRPATKSTTSPMKVKNMPENPIPIAEIQQHLTKMNRSRNSPVNLSKGKGLSPIRRASPVNPKKLVGSSKGAGDALSPV